MSSTPPVLIAIDPDDYAAKHVGKLANGRQFFLTTPFVPGGHEFVALYIFDRNGTLIGAHIDSFGPRSTVNEVEHRQTYEVKLRGLGPITIERIQIAPFSLERFGLQFGLVLRHPEDEDDTWAVEAQPGNYMAFFEPWDSGSYDT
jgi:hypothetical protein